MIGRERLLWVDALSINQTNLEEKAQQVAMIGKIFQQSVRVLAWVGEHLDNSELVFALSKDMQDLGARKWRQPRNFSRRRDIICAWTSFLDRRYFHRVWTFQEVVCHRDVLVCCGPNKKSWEDLITQRFMYKDFTIDDRNFNNLDVTRKKSFRKGLSQEEADRWIWTTENVGDLVLARDNYAGGDVELLEYILGLNRRECSDRRDRVYAVVSLVRNDAIAASIGTDYNISMPDLCYKVLMVTPKREFPDGWMLGGLLHHLGCDYNEIGYLVDTLLDRPDSAMTNDWDRDVESLVMHSSVEYTVPGTGYQHCHERIDNLLSWRTAARERGSWPQTPRKGGYPPFWSRYAS